MIEKDLFDLKTDQRPTIYALKHCDADDGYIKVGYTTRSAQERSDDWASQSGNIEQILGTWPAIRADGEQFTDRDVHKVLSKNGFKRKKNRHGNYTEWFECSLEAVKAAVIAVVNRTANTENRTANFKMRPEQEYAVEKTMRYFRSIHDAKHKSSPRFLWNAKMRFGKTFAAYELSLKMKFTKILVLTFKPAVKREWRNNLMTHIDFDGWQFISAPDSLTEPNIDQQYISADKTKPIVCFGSFQDFLGYDKKTKRIKTKNEWVHSVNWNLVIFDEYHYGAWRDKAQKLFTLDDDKLEYSENELTKYSAGNVQREDWLPITADNYLYLSGTPFRALTQGEFIEEQIFSWTYADEQRAKKDFNGPESDNPYAALPTMLMFTYKMSDELQGIARMGEFDEFSLNEFFRADGKGDSAAFIHENEVQKWLDLIRGAYMPSTVEDLKLGAKKPVMPFSDTRLLDVLNHTIWLLPDVASCYAMSNLLRKRQNTFYHDYHINVCAGPKAGIGIKALDPVLASMDDPLESKSITLSCGKLTTGVTVRPWTGIFMLRNISSPETYFQSAFRVQSPWVIEQDNGETKIIKRKCYIFDFALNRSLRLISDYASMLSTEARSHEQKVEEFINFLPVIAFDGSSMRQVTALEILDIAISGISATMLARRWESALLVNVDNDTLARLLANEKAMSALMKIEGFRSLNADIETIINKSNAVKKYKKSTEELTNKRKDELSAYEKEYKKKRKEIQEKLIKFATRIPVFMYLTDNREDCLQDVITQLEPELFQKVTGLEVKDFELLVSLNLFNESLMNDAVFSFKRYEDSSLTYTGIDRHASDRMVGLYSTSINKTDFDKMYAQVSKSMVLDK